MNSYTGTYHCGDTEFAGATLKLLPDRLQISFRDSVGETKLVHWPYGDIIRSSHYLEQDRVVVRYRGYPAQWVTLDNRMFIYELENKFNQVSQSRIRKAMGHGSSTLVKVMLALLTLAALVYFWLVPFLAGQLASRVPISYEVELGDAMYANITEFQQVDEKKTAYANQFFEAMNVTTSYPVRITVVRGDVVNAFALPGGHILVYDALIEELDQYEELAALFSHEYIHIQNRHATKSLFRKVASSVILAVLFGNSGSIAGAIIGNADELKDLSYSRGLEKEADLDGLKLLAARHIDGNGYLELFDMLKKESARQGMEVAEWISSHPDLDRRKKYIRESPYFRQGGVQPHETLQTLFNKVRGQ